jgi:threonine dehydrogenase-like Zn-dependent dehydrogenase
MARAIQFVRSIPRWLLAHWLAGRFPQLATGPFACIRLSEVSPPPLPNPEWVRIKTRLSGICGSDLSAIACQGSPYFSPFVSTPFVLGHEIVGDIVEMGSAVPSAWETGARVVVEPCLCCQVRGIQPQCRWCANGFYAHCENVTQGSIKAGIQTGYCASTGGGWSEATLVAHHSQLHAVPPQVTDEGAVLAEPFACAIHSALKAPSDKGSTVLVLGCGSIGLLVIQAYRLAGGKGRVLAACRYPHQASMARTLGADDCCLSRGSAPLYRWVLAGARDSAQTSSLYQPEIGKPVILGGVDAVLDCVGSSQSLDDALRLTRPGGKVIVVGMPGIPRGVDWTSVWYKELEIVGAYTYGWEQLPGGRRVRTMQLALEYLIATQGTLQTLVNARFRLEGYRTALEQAFHAGRSGTFKVVFAL